MLSRSPAPMALLLLRGEEAASDRPTDGLSVVSSFVGASQRQTENGEGKRRRMEKVCGAKRVERGRGKRKRRRRISRCGEEGRGRKGGRKYVSAHNFVSDLTCSCMTCQVLVVATRGGAIYESGGGDGAD